MVRSSSAVRFCAEKSSTGTFTSPKLIAPFQRPRAMAWLVAAHALQERREIVRVLLFLRQDLLEQASRGRIVLAEVVDHLAIAVDGDPLGDQVFLDHVLERVASTYSAWLREARPSGEKSGSPPSCVMRS